MRRLWRVTRWLLSIVVVLVLALGGLYLYLDSIFAPAVPDATYPAATDRAEAQRQDLDFLRNYLTLNTAYAPDARAEAGRLIDDLLPRAGTFTDGEFEMAVSSVVALSDNGHSVVWSGPRARRNNRLPCRIYAFADGMFVVRAKPACAELLGARIVAVDGRPIAEVLAALYPFERGPETHFRQFLAPYLLESPALLHGAGLATDEAAVTLTAVRPDGTTIERRIVAEPADVNAPRLFTYRYLDASPVAGESEDWQGLTTAGDTPLFLRDIDAIFRMQNTPDFFYLHFKSNQGSDDHPIGAFLEEAHAAILAAKPKTIVLDLRFNGGGDYTTTASFMENLASLLPPDGRLYVVTSGWTFSAGITSVVFAEKGGGDRTLLVGEPVGDRLRFWAEGGEFCLPNSFICMGFSTGLHDFTKSCWGEDGCYYPNLYFNPRVQSLDLDLPAAYHFIDFTSGRDPAIEKILAAEAGR